MLKARSGKTREESDSRKGRGQLCILHFPGWLYHMEVGTDNTEVIDDLDERRFRGVMENPESRLERIGELIVGDKVEVTVCCRQLGGEVCSEAEQRKARKAEGLWSQGKTTSLE